MVRKTRAKKTYTPSSSDFQSDRFRFRKNQEAYEKLNVFRPVWAKHKVILDKVDPEIHRDFQRRGWLPILDIEHPPSAALIKEFYSNFSIHTNDSNIQFMKSWIRGEEYVITLKVVASALGVPLVQQLVYPYTESPHLDNIMSLITNTTISWGSGPRVTSHELTELNYLIFRISCHSIWPISHLHTIPIEKCTFLYAFIIDAPLVSLPFLFVLY